MPNKTWFPPPEKFRFFLRSTGASIIICLAMVGIAIWFCPWILYLYGNEFAPGITCVQILMISIVFLSFSQMGGVLFFTGGKMKLYMKIAATACFINIVLNLLLIPVYGIEGAAIASMISYAALAVLTGFRLVRARTKTT